jgi:biopolymer transport protein ExbD
VKIRHTGSRVPEKVEQNMTPMIDVVFQLLAFFMFTLKIAEVEGNFNIKMPAQATAMADRLDTQLPLKVQLTAKADGTIDQILYNNKPLRDFAALRSQIVSFVGNDRAIKETAEVELDCDYHLHYRYVIDAITHVSGYITDDGQSRVELIEKIKFSEPKPPAGK